MGGKKENLERDGLRERAPVDILLICLSDIANLT